MQAIGKTLIDVIVVLFFVGMAGSLVVVLISFVEDFRELFGDDESVPDITTSPMKARTSAPEFTYGTSNPHARI